MFSTLKHYIKYHVTYIKHRITYVLYDMIKTRYEAQSWSITLDCPSCSHIIPVTAHFCAYCGRQVQSVEAHHNTSHLQNIDTLRIEQVTSKLPTNCMHGRFLAYAWAKKFPTGTLPMLPHQPQALLDQTMPLPRH
ncbi:hypothetical protein KDA_15840 [Dictyobacter alpinus]|uniref:Zinc-ribbon domain-containing protein n=1 Tax=Dictyobacter alpinus TaxID=2014873 RepID=A0A402B427_9CHLR|nr:zinc ribbon domain-containing protein [Dictyobacter alpinus]GCE26100.1 hypothetical protein KDA_15840 [Dictyobacter alpinus]